MEIGIFFRCVCINICALSFTCLEAKTISLNDIIAAERRNALLTTTGRPTTIRISDADAIVSHTKRTSPPPLKRKRTLEVQTPFRGKKQKISQRLRHKNKNTTKKREINHNDKIIQKYIPLLRNIRFLFDNILSPGSSEAFEPQRDKHKRNPVATYDKDIVCTCERKSSPEFTIPQKETSTSTTAIPTEVEVQTLALNIVTTTQAPPTVNDNIRRFGRYKNIPILFTRNPTGIWRNDSGFSERSSTSFNRSVAGHHPRNNGNSERNTRREIESYTEISEEYSNSDSRNSTSNGSSGRRRGSRIDSRDTEVNRETSKINEYVFPTNETFKDVTRNIYEHEGEAKFEIRGNQTESSTLLSEPYSRLREFDSKEKGTTVRTEINEKIFLQDSACNKRNSDRDGSFAAEIQKTDGTNDAIVATHLLPNSTFPTSKVVMIFDGYSVARDVNGNNKLTEQAIHIHT